MSRIAWSLVLVIAGSCDSAASGDVDTATSADATTGGDTALSGDSSTAADSSATDAGADVGNNGSCHGDAPCDGGDFCASYTLPPICGGVIDSTFDNDCDGDGDCAAHGADFICDARLCDFPHGGARTPLHCRRGCSVDEDCGVGLACTADHHCTNAACGGPADCGSANFECQGGSPGACVPKPCQHDSECADWCVNGACSATLGVCKPAVP